MDRVALVTGAGQGLGAAIAERLAGDGYRVVANDLDPETAAATAARIDGVARPFDCADPDAVTRAVADVERAVGPLHALVANHAYMTMAPFEVAAPDELSRHLAVNLLGTAWLLEAVAPAMRARGVGRIVCLSSEWGVTGWPEATAYAATKGGIVALVRSAARALGHDGITVNAIAPGVSDTPQLQVDADAAGVSREEMIAIYARDIPLGRVGRPSDIAAVASFLCSDAAAAMTGQIVGANGGTTTALP